MAHKIQFSTKYEKQVNGYDHETNNLYVVIETKAGKMQVSTGVFYLPYTIRPSEAEVTSGICTACRIFKSAYTQEPDGYYRNRVNTELGCTPEQVQDAFDAWVYGCVNG